MKVLLQRCLDSYVEIDSKDVGHISKGLVLFIGFTHTDDKIIVDKMVNKIINSRIFEDENNLMNLNILDKKGEILSISQFTLYANPYNGRRPSFTDAMSPDLAKELYNYFNEEVKKHNIKMETGVFGADMKIHIINDGPVTILLDSESIK